MKKFQGISDVGLVKTTESFFSEEFDSLFRPLLVFSWTTVSLHWNAFDIIERGNGKDLSLLSTLYKYMGNGCNLLVLDTELSLKVKSTTLLYCMVFIGNEILFVLDFTVFWQFYERGQLVFDDLKI